MTCGDQVDQIMAIMACAFDPAYGEAWTRKQVEDALMLGNCHALVADAAGKLAYDDEPGVGFALSRTGFEEEELLLFAVSPEYRARGIGRAILDTFALAARSRGAKRLLLEMRKNNPAERLYRTFGFSVIGERKDYYRTHLGTRIDAVTFAYEFDSFALTRDSFPLVVHCRYIMYFGMNLVISEQVVQGPPIGPTLPLSNNGRI